MRNRDNLYTAIENTKVELEEMELLLAKSETQPKYEACNIKVGQLRIIEYYSSNNQIKKLIEECAELIVAITQLHKKGQSLNIRPRIPTVELEYVIEELADVENLIEQIKLNYKLVGDGVDQVKRYKVNRELDRISQRHQDSGHEGKSKELDCEFDL